MPGFYHLPESVADMVDFVASRILAAAGVDLALIPSWGSR
jgi:4-hydroxy-3-polyprenylbenzoate decarboxylase